MKWWWPDKDEWPTHRPAAPEAPIPGKHHYSTCDDGSPKVTPDGICQGCGKTACPFCGKGDCPGSCGTAEKDGGKPRVYPADAYASFMAMGQSEWLGLIFGGGVLTPVEQHGFERALADRQAEDEQRACGTCDDRGYAESPDGARARCPEGCR